MLLGSDVLAAAGAADRRRRGDGRAADRARELVRADARPRHERDVPGRRPGDDRPVRRRPSRRWRNGGGPFAGDTSTLAEAVAYVEANGGGTIAVSSQSGAAGQLIAQGADVAAIGGFSGRESEVSLEWLAQAVADGRIRYVLTDGADGLQGDGRVGSSEVMAAVEELGTPTGVEGLYDVRGLVDQCPGRSDETAGRSCGLEP